jgi:hypothetical protein
MYQNIFAIIDDIKPEQKKEIKTAIDENELLKNVNYVTVTFYYILKVNIVNHKK